MAKRDEEARNFTVFFPVLKRVVLGESVCLFVCQVCLFVFSSHNALFADRAPCFQSLFFKSKSLYVYFEVQSSINLKLFDPRNTTLY